MDTYLDEIYTRALDGTGRTLTLKPQKLINHLLSFDPKWKPELETLIAEERKAAVDSVITLRHGIVHGRPGDVTIARMNDYYAEVVKVMSGIRALMQIDD